MKYRDFRSHHVLKGPLEPVHWVLHREIGGIVSYVVHRWLRSDLLTFSALLFVAVGMSMSIMRGDPLWIASGYAIAVIIDFADGPVARARGEHGLRGAKLDLMVHHGILLPLGMASLLIFFQMEILAVIWVVKEVVNAYWFVINDRSKQGQNGSEDSGVHEQVGTDSATMDGFLMFGRRHRLPRGGELFDFVTTSIVMLLVAGLATWLPGIAENVLAGYVILLGSLTAISTTIRLVKSAP